MTALAARAPGKVNLTLYVGRSRPDGYHPLASAVQSLSLADALRLEPAPPDAAGDRVDCPGVEGDNLALRALAAFREATGWDAPPQLLTIAKRVPVAAGMGGGSSDAAAALRLAAAASGTPVPDGLAARLGADVPALLAGGRVLMTGAGEVVEPLPAPAAEPGLLVVPSARSLSTAAVYAEFDRLGLGREPAELEDLAGAIRASGGTPVNDLEPAALSLLPEISAALDAVREAGAEHALVSGSGPTVFGLFASPAAAGEAGARLPGAVAARPVDPGFGSPRPA